MRRDINRDEVVRLYVEEKLSTPEVEKRLGLSKGAVRSILVIRGITLRTVKESLQIKYPNGRFGKVASNWKGGRRIANQAGYICIYKPDHPCATKEGYVMEHRLAVEDRLGRILHSKEVIHHINGIKTDNRPENLQLMTVTEHRKEHMEAHLKLYESQEEIKRLQARIAELERLQQV